MAVSLGISTKSFVSAVVLGVKWKGIAKTISDHHSHTKFRYTQPQAALGPALEGFRYHCYSIWYIVS